MEHEYEENKETLFEVFHDIMYHSDYELQVPWLVDWIEYCETQISEALNKSNGSQMSFLGSYYQLTAIVNDQLGNNTAFAALINLFIKNY